MKKHTGDQVVKKEYFQKKPFRMILRLTALSAPPDKPCKDETTIRNANTINTKPQPKPAHNVNLETNVPGPNTVGLLNYTEGGLPAQGAFGRLWDYRSAEWAPEVFSKLACVHEGTEAGDPRHITCAHEEFYKFEEIL
jgi:hypothetical protein